MHIRHIEVLHAIMRTGTVSGASKILNVSQPAISKALRRAEDQLAFKLFDRVRGRLYPTPEGRAIYMEAERLFAGLENIQKLATNIRTGEVDRLRIAAASALSIDILPLAISQFRLEHPHAICEIETFATNDICSAVLNRSVDVGFAFEPPEHPGLFQFNMCEARFFAIFPPDCAQPLPAFVEFEDLVHLPFVGLQTGDPMDLIFQAACKDACVNLIPQVKVKTYEIAASLVSRGAGVAVVDQYSALTAKRLACKIVPFNPDVVFFVRGLVASHNLSSVQIKRFRGYMERAGAAVAKELGT
ncbi:MAG: LysR family transcriptional regulator [Hyphomicrobiales bacterium]|nr:LysR family transcriptional regulator [Hyphomicrobiales bacterium]